MSASKGGRARFPFRPIKTEIQSSAQGPSSRTASSPSGARDTCPQPRASRPQTGGPTRPRRPPRGPAPALRPRPAPAAAIATQKAPWLPPAGEDAFRHCRQRPNPSHRRFRHVQQLPPEGGLGSVWSTRIPRGAPACLRRCCAGSRAWISASSPGTSAEIFQMAS